MSKKALIDNDGKIAKVMMATQEGPQRKRPAAKPDEETRVALDKARTEAEEIEGERQARAKVEQARTEAKGAKQTIRTDPENTEPPPPALEEEGAERRVTFIIRLTVDERGQPRRTEIEHAQSGKKEIFPDLDVQRLANFMKACISSPNHPGTDDPPSTSLRESRSPDTGVS